MENSTDGKAYKAQFAPRRSFARWKEKPFRTKDYLDLLVHYDAELRQTGVMVTIVGRATGEELRLEQRGKSQMVKLLLDEFGTVDGANKAIERYGSSRP
jgi:hypothetical protein